VEHEAEYAAFVAERWSPLVRTAVFLGASAHEAEDLVQATLLLCYRKWDRVRAADDRDGYVYRMLLNVLRSDRRSAWWRHRSPHPVGSARKQLSATPPRPPRQPMPSSGMGCRGIAGPERARMLPAIVFVFSPSRSGAGCAASDRLFTGFTFAMRARRPRAAPRDSHPAQPPVEALP